jgi:ferredoxin-NADP reductase
MIQPWQTGIIKRIEQATHNTRRYWVELPESPAFMYKPGQFVTLDLPIHEQRNKRWRSYSIAAMADGGNVIELLIVFVEGGLASRYIFEELREGSSLTLRGPQGIFVLPELLDRDIFLICTGTGIAPFRSMLQSVVYEGLPHKRIHLLFGTRTQEDLLYHEEMEQLQQALPAFNYYPTLSRETWDGEMGYVHNTYERLCRDKQPAYFMLCGWRAMIDEAKERILGMGYDKKDVHIEIYG